MKTVTYNGSELTFDTKLQAIKALRAIAPAQPGENGPTCTLGLHEAKDIVEAIMELGVESVPPPPSPALASHLVRERAVGRAQSALHEVTQAPADGLTVGQSVLVAEKLRAAYRALDGLADMIQKCYDSNEALKSLTWDEGAQAGAQGGA